MSYWGCPPVIAILIKTYSLKVFPSVAGQDPQSWDPSPEVWASGHHPGVDQVQSDPQQADESVYPGVDTDGPEEI